MVLAHLLQIVEVITYLYITAMAMCTTKLELIRKKHEMELTDPFYRSVCFKLNGSTSHYCIYGVCRINGTDCNPYPYCVCSEEYKGAHCADLIKAPVTWLNLTWVNVLAAVLAGVLLALLLSFIYMAISRRRRRAPVSSFGSSFAAESTTFNQSAVVTMDTLRPDLVIDYNDKNSLLVPPALKTDLSPSKTGSKFPWNLSPTRLFEISLSSGKKSPRPSTPNGGHGSRSTVSFTPQMSLPGLLTSKLEYSQPSMGKGFRSARTASCEVLIPAAMDDQPALPRPRFSSGAATETSMPTQDDSKGDAEVFGDYASATPSSSDNSRQWSPNESPF